MAFSNEVMSSSEIMSGASSGESGPNSVDAEPSAEEAGLATEAIEDEAESQTSNEMLLAGMKAEKAIRKRKFTIRRRAALVALRDAVEEETGVHLFRELELAEDGLNSVLVDIQEFCAAGRDVAAMRKVTEEIDEVAEEMRLATQRYDEFVDRCRSRKAHSPRQYLSRDQETVPPDDVVSIRSAEHDERGVQPGTTSSTRPPSESTTCQSPIVPVITSVSAPWVNFPQESAASGDSSQVRVTTSASQSDWSTVQACAAAVGSMNQLARHVSQPAASLPLARPSMPVRTCTCAGPCMCTATGFSDSPTGSVGPGAASTSHSGAFQVTSSPLATCTGYGGASGGALSNVVMPDGQAQQQNTAHAHAPVGQLKGATSHQAAPAQQITQAGRSVGFAYTRPSVLVPSAPHGTHQPAQQPVDEVFRQLRSIKIPVFSGEKKQYTSWKAAFTACVGSSSASPELKLLHLRQYLSGEALSSIDSLGYTASAYQAAMNRLDRKFGGEQRQVTLQYEQVEAFPPVRVRRASDLQCFANLLDVLVVNLLDSGKGHELGNGLLYRKLQSKLPSSMLTQFNRWCHGSIKAPSIQALLEWVTLEAEFAIGASETLEGIGTSSKSKSSAPRNLPQRNYFTKSSVKVNSDSLTCAQCRGKHGVWHCKSFRQLSATSRWKQAKQLGLCFRCLGGGHRGQDCPRTRTCSVVGCGDNHHYLLHRASKDHDSTTPDKAKVDDQATAQTGSEAQFCGHTTSGTVTEGADRSTSPTTNSLTKQSVIEIGTSTDEASCATLSLTEGETQPPMKCSTMMTQHLSQIDLRVVPVVLQNGNKSVTVNALLDDGSTTSYLNSSIASRLGVSGELRTMTVSTLNGKVDTFTTTPVSFLIKSRDGQVQHSMTALTTDSVTGNLQPVNWLKEATNYPHLNGIPFPSLARPAVVDLLIGSDHAELHVSHQDVVGPPGQPVARRTPLGWTCVGRLTTTSPVQGAYHCQMLQCFNSPAPPTLETTLQRFWQIDSCGTEECFSDPGPMSLQEEAALHTVQQSLKRVDGRYQVSIPWNDRKRELCNNLDTAVKRLSCTERKLRKDQHVAHAYGNVFQSYQEKGYIRELSCDDLKEEQCWYLPHFAIVRPQKTTTKVRIVFDAAASCNGISLNDAIYHGPKLQRDLCDVLTRFRRRPVAVGCDVAEMYLQVAISPDDRKYLRFVWRGMDPNKPVRHYEFTRLVFGVNAAPFIAQYVAQQTAREHLKSHPLAAEAILASTYMDDTMDSAENLEQGLALHQELTELWGKAKMKPRKWVSNSAELLKSIPAEDRAAQLDLSQGELPSLKTLGVSWDGQDDSFFFCFQPPDLTSQLITKRFFLARVATVFDPLGFLTPFVMQAKVLMQECWVAGVGWDEPVPDSINTSARQWFDDLNQLHLIRVPRCLIMDPVGRAELRVFCDASSVAYGAVVYICTVQHCSDRTIRFAAAKSRVAPTKTQSIPRLELMAAVLGTQLARKIGNILSIAMSAVTLWGDSTTVLHWLRSYSRRFKPFVANRISSIQSYTSPSQWRYVPSSDNPADLASRGAGVVQLAGAELWWQGPSFLRQNESEWPVRVVGDLDSAGREEACKNGQLDAMTLMCEEVPNLCPRRFSDWTKMVRVHAWARRFISNCRGGERLRGDLTCEEMNVASLSIIWEAQTEAFAEDLKLVESGQGLPPKSRLAKLSPRLNEDKVLRCDGRTQLAEWLPFDVRFPIILPRKHPVTRLIIRDCHEQRHHGGTNETLAALSDHYLVEAAREEIRDWEKDCMVCRKRKARSGEQVMAPLPVKRLCEPLRAFARVAVDYGGPFETIQGRGKTRRKRYLCLFTCLLSRAVHLEVAYALDSNSFLNAFNRMVNRRGCPMEVLSDNGGNFVNADRQLRDLVCDLDDARVRRAMACRRVKWTFNPPLAPHFGGVHESMIWAAKRALRGILGNASVTDEELVTAFSGAESLINSRPITYQSASPSDPGPLTPNHFLYGRAEG